MCTACHSDCKLERATYGVSIVSHLSYPSHVQVRRLLRWTRSTACCSGRTLLPAARPGTLQGGRVILLPRRGAPIGSVQMLCCSCGYPCCGGLAVRQCHVQSALPKLRAWGGLNPLLFATHPCSNESLRTFRCRARSCAQLLAEVQAAMQERGLQLCTARQAESPDAASGSRVAA